MPQPLVSVRMCTYNHVAYIRRAIEGVLSQRTTFPFELIIGEDCSTDGTRAIVFDFQRRHPDIIRVVTSDQNVGMRRNGYRMSAHCGGKYIAFCEGDDYWQRPDKLQLQVDHLEAHPECGLVHSEHDRYYPRLSKTIHNFFRTSGNVPPEGFNLFRGWGAGYHILTCTVMLRHDLLREIRSDPTIYGNLDSIGGTDIPQFIEIGMRSKIAYLDESLATYTVHSDSASNTTDRVRKARFCKCNIESYLYLAKKYHDEQEQRRLEQTWRQIALWVAFFERDEELAKTAIGNGDRPALKARLLYWGARNAFIHNLLYVLDAGHHQMRRRMDERRLMRWVAKSEASR